MPRGLRNSAGFSYGFALTARLGVAAGLAALLSVHAARIDGAAGDVLRVGITGTVIPDARVRSVVVNGEAVGIDEALVTLERPDAFAIAGGESLRVDAIAAGGESVKLFDGEVVTTAMTVRPLEGPALVVRALNRMHRLHRDRKTRIYEGQSDSEIARLLAQEAGLNFAPSGGDADGKQDRVAQHDQTDLEFLRARAARIGYQVFVEDSTLYFRRRPDSLLVALGCSIRDFHPGLWAASRVAGVTVRGWDPVRNAEILGTATRPTLRFSDTAPTSLQAAARVATIVDLGSVPTLANEASSHGAALGALLALTASDLSGEANVAGNPALRTGVTIEIAGVGVPFDGKYVVTGVSHRFDQGSSNGYHTLLRILRADRAVFALPEVDDEVLIAFEHGDLSRPTVVGSMWTDADDDPPVERRPCTRP